MIYENMAETKRKIKQAKKEADERWGSRIMQSLKETERCSGNKSIEREERRVLVGVLE